MPASKAGWLSKEAEVAEPTSKEAGWLSEDEDWF